MVRMWGEDGKNLLPPLLLSEKHDDRFHVCCFEMNLALVHNRQHIQTLWEKRISSRCQYEENEEQRMEKSALKSSQIRPSLICPAPPHLIPGICFCVPVILSVHPR
ncbi:uncharacterized protein LOC130525881 isoform X2 [Takifugu flavidus]|uniref:uncharacterized protein LOC130525881 isoform X2 n=1 Tax=Takifugu flavidus TaxID=433684 RepID=UPI00254482F5|nr:uncharacterized protein LOC130525881 isoform X2 [Takifugu flavidus]